jgi:hypothetical protein
MPYKAIFSSSIYSSVILDFILLFLLEPILKIGFWFKIPSSPQGFAGTSAAPIPPEKAGSQKTFLRWVLKRITYHSKERKIFYIRWRKILRPPGGDW